MKPARTVRRIIETLSEQHPNADTELHYRNAFELLAATILSAQSTDERVNIVTPALFARYPDARALSAAAAEELEPQILSTGFFRQKSKALIGMAQALVAAHGGEVPADIDKLTALPGVGRKTANVVLGHALGVPGLPVDRHVLRVANRIGIAEGEDPVKVEAQLCSALPKEMWTLASDVQILHGRRVCKPKPLCDICLVREECDYYRLVVGPATAGPHGKKRGWAAKGRALGRKRAGLEEKQQAGPREGKKASVRGKQEGGAPGRTTAGAGSPLRRRLNGGANTPRKHEPPRVRKARR
jgi:endonuclease-3